MRKWFSLDGRASRKEWWMMMAITTLAAFFIGFAALLLLGRLVIMSVGGDESYSVGIVLVFLAVAGVFLASLAAYYTTSIRRYHDRGKSGWWVLIAFIPVIGGIWQLVELGLLKGTEENNPYGTGSMSVPEKSLPKMTVGDLMKSI